MNDLHKKQYLIKRLFDILLSIILIFLFIPFFLILLLITSIDTSSFGILSQQRIGRYAVPFQLLKFKTMKGVAIYNDNITTSDDPHITKIGRYLRKTKIDELPQLFNILVGQMSFVGPRPDVSGYADKLTGEDKIILTVRPGLTGPASLTYKDEEYILSQKENPIAYNDQVIWPHKVKINKDYIKNYSLTSDFKFLLQTVGIL